MLQEYLPDNDIWRYQVGFYKGYYLQLKRAKYDLIDGQVHYHPDNIFPRRIVPMVEELVFNGGVADADKPVIEPNYKDKVVLLSEDDEATLLIKKAFNYYQISEVYEGWLINIWGDRQKIIDKLPENDYLHYQHSVNLSGEL